MFSATSKKTRAKQKPTALPYTAPAPTEHILKQTNPHEKSTAARKHSRHQKSR
jgi:hypothetical protein